MKTFAIALLVASTSALTLDALLQIKASIAKKDADPHFNDPFHPVLPDPIWSEHIKNLKPVAGPSVTDQIGASVANSSNEGADAIPMFPS